MDKMQQILELLDGLSRDEVLQVRSYVEEYVEEMEEPIELTEETEIAREFAFPGGNSALRAAGPGNPRNLPCPTCKKPNRLTPKDVALHYQCDSCADALERGF